ncbi:MAG TPA: cytochrome P460 family protein [Humidesulfovibrio sp.]|uniref:cytochrome P460 family protein n=1 Tax=Humidesulfovibrio sp. TaxID=2910988 RepID=UPI002B98E45E|nr:cytochrome P460 family protein [Humidesulfovibrio sp.]HWR05052.1 cytochrome P460 family protein [Humidesulfovibrio sp.]
MNRTLEKFLYAAGLCALLLPAGLLAADMGMMQQGAMQQGAMPQQGMMAQGAGMMQNAEGAALLMHITKTDPYVKWDLMPGTTRMRQGMEPHGALQNVYVNKLALKAITGKAGMLPDGAIIVKENYTKDGKLAAVTVMNKKKGYNPDAGDYLWLKFTPDMKIQAQGKADPCIKCHAKAKDNDWVMLAPLK